MNSNLTTTEVIRISKNRLSEITVFCLSVFCLFTLPSDLSASSPDTKIKKVRNIEGRYELYNNISREEAERRALKNAKINALRKAGVSEKLWSVTGLLKEDDGTGFNQVLSQMITLEMDGFINISDEIIYREEIEDGRTYIVAMIKEAEVKKGDDTDPTFVLSVEGVESLYRNGDPFSFKTKIYGSDAYLRIFWFDDNGGTLIFPSEYESDILLKKETEYCFPLNPMIEYTMEKSDKKCDFETINLVVVATKKKIPFTEETITFESLISWIYHIPASSRAAFREVIMIK